MTAKHRNDWMAGALFTTRATAILVTVASVFTAGCKSADRPDTHTRSVRDSVGIRIADNASPEWAGGNGWRIDSVPLVDIGSAGDDSVPVLARVGGVVPWRVDSWPW
jgi:hypothetical protein